MNGGRNFQGNMAKYMNKNPYTTQREHNAFLRELRQFHESRGTSFRKNPCLNGREINLSHLYNEVTNLGGWRKVNETQKWDIILQSLGIPKACANANLALKQFYIRYLDHYEKIHFLGEDPDDDAVDSGENPARKSHNMTFLVPLTYNHHQHDVSDAMRTQAGLADVINVSDYEKLMLSLKSGLPNEVDFALNVCTLLSNEGKHTLHLEKAPHLIDLLVSHAGVWTESNKSLKDLLEERWSKMEGRQMAKFWNDTVEDKEVRELYLLETKGNKNPDKELFQFSRQLGVRELEGQRVLQIAMILWNLSFEENNMPVLASSPTCLKFLFLCIHCKWAYLCQMGLDTLGNIAAEINLDPMDCLNLQVMFRTISRSLLSSDRFLMIRGLDILAGLCKVEANEEKIIKHLDKMLYEKICSLLTIHDIMLLIYTLECLYYLTDLGHDICSNIVQIHKIIEVLVSLITVEAQSYGSSACIAMKVVETSVPAPPVTPVPTNQRQQTAPSPASNTSVKNKAVTQATPVVHGYQEADNDTFAYNWLKAYYEWSPNSSLLQNELYVDYQTTCNKLGKKGLVPPSQLLNLLKSLYPQIKTRPSNSQNYRSEIHLDGIKRRIVTLPVSIYMPTKGNATNSSVTSASSSVIHRNSNVLSPLPSSNSTLSGSPILKAQLSAPPRPPTSSAVGHHPHLQQALLGRSQPSAVQPTAATPPSTPPHSIISTKDSTLIKSLLANKVSQNMLLRQQQQQHVQAIVTTSANSVTTTTESSSTVSSISSTSSSSSSPASTPCLEIINQKTVTTKMVTSVSNTIISSVLCSKDGSLNNPSICPRSPKSRINGAPRTVQLEVCARLEPTKDVENKEFQEARIDRVENILCASGEIAEKHKSEDSLDNNEPTLDKLLRGNAVTLQNGLSTAQNGNRSESDSPKLLTMEASPPLGISDPPIRRKGVLADLLEGRVHKDTLLSMNGIIDRSEHLNDGSANVNNPSVSTSTSTVCVTCSSCTTIQTNSTVTSIAIVGSNCNSVFAVKTAPLLNGEGIMAKPVKVVLPCGDSPRTANNTLKETSRIEVSETSRSCVNGNSESVRVGNETSSVPTIPSEWTSSPSASKVIVPPKSIETEELIGFPRVSLEQLNQLRQKAESLRATNKRPSNEPSSLSLSDIKRVRVEERLMSSSLSSSTSSSSSSSSSSSTLGSSSSSSALSLPSAHGTVLMDLKGNRSDEKFLPLPILTPSEAQQQVSAVLQGSFADKPSQPPLSDKNSSQKFVSNELLKNQSHCQPKLTPKIEVQNITKNSGMITSKTERKNSIDTVKEENKPVSRVDGNSMKISVSSLSSSSPPPTSTLSSSTSKKLEYICEWKDCLKSFESPMAVFVHACKAHAPEGSINIPCLWEGCDHMSRQRLSLMTHLQDRHCNDHMLRLQATRRQQLAQMGSSTIPPPASPLPHPGYAPNAAVQAIRRHALEFIANKELTAQNEVAPFPKIRGSSATPPTPTATNKAASTDVLPLSVLQDEKEGPVTKSIRLTAALILRNLIMYSSLAKSLVKKYEAHLSMVAMSNVESSRTVAQCLWELNRQQESRVR